MRSSREALMIFVGLPAGVMPRMMACTRSNWLSSTAASVSFIWPALAACEQVADRSHLADGEHLLEEVLQGQLTRTDLGRGLGLASKTCSACLIR